MTNRKSLLQDYVWFKVADALMNFLDPGTTQSESESETVGETLQRVIGNPRRRAKLQSKYRSSKTTSTDVTMQGDAATEADARALRLRTQQDEEKRQFAMDYGTGPTWRDVTDAKRDFKFKIRDWTRSLCEENMKGGVTMTPIEILTSFKEIEVAITKFDDKFFIFEEATRIYCGKEPSTQPEVTAPITEAPKSVSYQGTSHDVPTAGVTSDVAIEINVKLNEIKRLLDLSGNIKRDVKIGIQQSVEAIKSLVKAGGVATSHDVAGVSQSTQPNQQTLIDHMNAVATRMEEATNENVKRLLAPIISELDGIKARQKIINRVTEATSSDAAVAHRVTPTYASAARQAIPKKELKRHVIIASGTGEWSTSADGLRGHIRKTIKPSELGIGVQRFQRVSDDKVLIECQSADELTRLKEKMAASCPNVKTEDGRLKRPKLIIRGVDVSLTSADVIKNVISQNEEMKTVVGTQTYADVIRVCFEKKNGYNAQLKNVIIEVLPTLRPVMRRGVKLGWKICDVDDFSPVTTCYKCQGHGHVSKHCKSTSDVCFFCGDDHKIQDCQKKTDAAKKKCVNCTRHNDKSNDGQKKLDVGHTSIDAKCPSLVRATRIAESRIDYGHQPT